MTERASFQTSLFQNVVKGASGQIVFRMWNGNPPGFIRMLVLAVIISLLRISLFPY